MTPTKHFSPPQPSRPLWQTLLAPMLLASLGLHGLVLMLPTGAAGDAVIPPPDPEQDNVAITRIPPAAANPAASPVVPLPGAAGQPVPQRPIQPVAAASPQATQAAPGRPAATRPATRSPHATAPTSASRSTPPSLPGPTAATDDAAPVRVTPPNPGVPTPAPTPSPISQDRREQVLAYLSGLDFSQERIDQLAATMWQRYGYSGQDTTRGEYTGNLNQWQVQIQQETGRADLVAEEDRTNLEVSFARRVCLAQAPGEVKVGFVANPDGSFRQEPVVLRSSGYAELNQKALDVVRQHEVPAADQIKAYTVTVETSVDYGENDCLEPLQQPSGTSTDT